MKPEAQRIAIAEAQGYRRLKGDPWKLMGTAAWMPLGMTVTNFIRMGEPATYVDDLPDYLNDLNAMHEAVMSQSGEFRLRFRNALAELRGAQHYHNATAAQRAEAFLKALNLWEE